MMSRAIEDKLEWSQEPVRALRLKKDSPSGHVDIQSTKTVCSYAQYVKYQKDLYSINVHTYGECFSIPVQKAILSCISEGIKSNSELTQD